ncbi:gfo/Idh/MocA family oxidoreductase [Leptotrichia sp. OH3620_COT-345]|uniref:Gfo/Idh/MocA family protein n=1 Tax=Leptotrichia sp. OH3620_COT-345 TaxID=2491048 RepID=UPI000F651D33|nr:Gfo/Idh/MocA family oxidoreductase [Leptotrichia sp. OH3620_COT-345]RRD40174.1 gfo/Idh/MocA family oxidoreductase [Leptotrichia sp. OH3620_COT-345]
MKKIRLGIIGYGAEGGLYASFFKEKKLSENLKLTAVCDIDIEKEKKVKESFPDIKFFKNYKDMLDSGLVDAIVTTVPHYFHCEMGIEAIKRGIHLLGEKPAGVYTKDVKRLIKVSEEHPDVTFAIFFNQRTNPLYRKVKELMDNKVIGNMRRTVWIITTWWRPQGYYNQSEWRATWGGEGGGVLVNQAPHQLDLWQWICGKPKKVFAKMAFGFKRDIVVEDEVNALVDFGNGVTGSFITCTHDILGTDYFEILGDKGKIIVENSKKLTIKTLKKDEEILSNDMSMEDVIKLFKGQLDPEEMYDEEVLEFDSRHGEQHINVLENFAAHILNGDPLLAAGREGINGVRLANAMHLSAWLGKEVNYELNEREYLDLLNNRIRKEGKYEEKQ